MAQRYQYADPSEDTRYRNRKNRLERDEVRRINDDTMLRAGARRGMSPVDQQAYMNEMRAAASPTDARKPILGAAVAQRNPPMASAGVANPPPIRYADDPTAPRAAGTPSRILGPNIAKGETDPTKIAVALAQNRAAVAPGGMGTASYTQDAQASQPAMPTNFNMRSAPLPAPRVLSEGVRDPAAELAQNPNVTMTNSPATGRTITSQYGTGSAQTPVQAETTRRLALQKAHPGIFTADTPESPSPENRAFVAHAKQFGLESAFKNVDDLMKGVGAEQMQADRRTAAEPLRGADYPAPPEPLPHQVGQAIAGGISRVQEFGQAIGSVPGKIGRAYSDFTAGLTGRQPGATPMPGARPMADPTARIAMSPEELRKRKKRIPGSTGG